MKKNIITLGLLITASIIILTLSNNIALFFELLYDVITNKIPLSTLHYQGVFSNNFFSFMIDSYYFEFSNVSFYILIALSILITVSGIYNLFRIIKKVLNNVM